MPSDSQLSPWSDRLTPLLHFDQVLDAIGVNCITEAGSDAVSEISPIDDPETRLEMLTASGELVQLLEANSPPPLYSFDDLRPLLAGREKGGSPLSPNAFGSLRSILILAENLQKYFSDLPQFTVWPERAQLLNPWDVGVGAISKIIDDNRLVMDSASDTLRSVRKSMRRKEDQVKSKLDAIHSRAMSEGWGQDEPVAWRDGRLVIAFKSSHKRKIKGLIHGHSSSGNTAFVEPLEVFDLNNEIAALKEKEQEEIVRLLTELTDKLRPFIGDVLACIDTLYQLDASLAVARWAIGVSAVVPTFSADGSLKLIQARNPALATLHEVVPLNLELTAEDRLLLISGPNTGGKTVVLLTVGLLSMLAHSGLPVPAKEAGIPELTGIYADLGDGQSLEQNLSTFSAHLLNLSGIAKACGPGSLVLLDELGTGTEPDSGAALGQAFLETIRAKGALCLVTTHLNRLKEWAHNEPGVLSGAMTFDSTQFAPTYHLQLHQPGASYALEIAQRLGLDRTILERARALIPDAALELEDLLITLQASRTALDSDQAEFDERQADITSREQALQGREEQIRSVQRRAENDALRQAKESVDGINKQLEGVIAEIRSRGDDLTKDDIRAAKGAITAIRQDLADRSETIITETPLDLKPEDIAKGQWVQVVAQGRDGEVMKVSRNGRKVTVDLSGTRITVSPDQLAMASAPKRAVKDEPSISVGFSSSAKYQLDIRGERGDEAIERLEQFLNQAIIGGLIDLEVIHGKGTGILQKLVHEKLAEHPSVAQFNFANFDAGGTGATLVKLK